MSINIINGAKKSKGGTGLPFYENIEYIFSNRYNCIFLAKKRYYHRPPAHPSDARISHMRIVECVYRPPAHPHMCTKEGENGGEGRESSAGGWVSCVVLEAMKDPVQVAAARKKKGGRAAGTHHPPSKNH